MERTLLILGCCVFILLGVLHYGLTAFSRNFEASAPELTEEMKRVSPVLSRQTSIWRTWVGLHLSHSLGLALFGLLFVVIAVQNYPYLRGSVPLNLILFVVPLLYLILCIRYWFDSPRNGVLLGLILIALSFVLRLRSS